MIALLSRVSSLPSPNTHTFSLLLGGGHHTYGRNMVTAKMKKSLVKEHHQQLMKNGSMCGGTANSEDDRQGKEKLFILSNCLTLAKSQIKCYSC